MSSSKNLGNVIFIIEDEPAITRVLKRKISKKGFLIKTATSLKEARKLFLDEAPCAVFLDYVLSDGRSSDLVTYGVLSPEYKIFLMSAFMDDLEKKDFLNLNVTFLKKPFESLDEVLSGLD